MTRFDDRTVLITGGGSGIGLATARRLVDAGANVVLAGRNASRLEAAVVALGAGDRVLAVPTDVTRLADLAVLMDAVRSRFAGLDGVFANAGLARFARSAEVAEQEFDELIAVNLKGVFFTVTKALPLIRPGGAVVVCGSWLAHRGKPFTSVYAASKAAVLNLARTLAADVADRGIRVNAVSPGFVVTDMFTGIANTPEAQESCRGQVVLGRLGAADDIATAVLFLLSGDAAYVTGQELLVDGGLITADPA
jgi:NAD(P)-dependent dehydrogenase (short-subunit alcohol dehydrogenase family)